MAMGAVALACVCAQSCEPSSNPANQPTSRGRKNDEVSVPSRQVSLRGILIDAGCQDRESPNLRSPAESLQAESPAEPPNAAQGNPPMNGAVSAKGITVDAATLKAERTGAMASRVPELFERQSDPTCSITGSTTSFALLADNGQLIDLDAGGNTLALEAVESTDAGRALLNGHGPGVKPRVTVTGQIRGERLVTQDLSVGG
jgi:hypothetical protein